MNKLKKILSNSRVQDGFNHAVFMLIISVVLTMIFNLIIYFLGFSTGVTIILFVAFVFALGFYFGYNRDDEER